MPNRIADGTIRHTSLKSRGKAHIFRFHRLETNQPLRVTRAQVVDTGNVSKGSGTATSGTGS